MMHGNCQCLNWSRSGEERKGPLFLSTWGFTALRYTILVFYMAFYSQILGYIFFYWSRNRRVIVISMCEIFAESIFLLEKGVYSRSSLNLDPALVSFSLKLKVHNFKLDSIRLQYSKSWLML